MTLQVTALLLWSEKQLAMALNIVVDRPGPYQPGATISGHVELTSIADEAIAYIDINFTGRCKVKIRKHDHYTTLSYRSRGYYFSQHLSLYAEGKYKHKAGTYTWPFTFAIPEHASRRQVSGPASAAKSPTSWRPQRQMTAIGVLQPGIGHELDSDFFPVRSPWRASALNALQPHPLPESFAYSHSGFPTDFEARVEYTLVASLTRPAGSILFSPKNLEASTTIILKPLRAQNARDLVLNLQKHKSEHTISTLRLLPSNFDRKISLLEKTRSRLSSSSAPTCTFQVLIRMPRYLAPSVHSSDTFPFSLVVSRLKLPQSDKIDVYSDSIPTPTVKLTNLTLWIRARTLLRDNSKGALDQTVDHEDRLLNISRTGLDIDIPVINIGAESPSAIGSPPGSPTVAKNSFNFSQDSKAPVVAEQIPTPPKLELGKLLNLRLDQNVLSPDFSTYNIYRSYTMGFKIKLEAVGETIEVNLDGVRVRVLPEIAPLQHGARDSRVPRAPPTPPSDNDRYDEKNGPTPREPPPDANAGEDELPQYEQHASEGPLPAFQQEDTQGSPTTSP